MTAALLAGRAQAVQRAGPDEPMTVALGGDPFTDRTVSQYEARCGARTVLIRIAGNAGRPSVLEKVTVDGRDLSGRPEVEELRRYVAQLSLALVRGARCYERTASISIAGSILTGDSNFFSATIPLEP